MQNIPFRTTPIALTSTLTTNLLNPGTTTGGVNCTAAPYDKLYLVIYQIRIADKGGAGGTFTLYMGATGANVAGTELAKTFTCPTNGEYNLSFPKGLRLAQADFIVGGASGNTLLTAQFIGELGIGA